MFGDDFHVDIASSLAYDQDRSQEVSAVDTEITRNVQEDEVEVEVSTTFLFYLRAHLCSKINILLEGLKEDKLTYIWWFPADRGSFPGVCW